MHARDFEPVFQVVIPRTKRLPDSLDQLRGLWDGGAKPIRWASRQADPPAADLLVGLLAVTYQAIDRLAHRVLKRVESGAPRWRRTGSRR